MASGFVSPVRTVASSRLGKITPQKGMVALTRARARLRLAAEPLLHLQRQTVHAAAHVRYAACDPHLHPGGKGDHDASRIGNRRTRVVGSSEAGIVSRRPFGRPISIVLSSSDRRGGARAPRYSRRRRVNKDRDNHNAAPSPSLAENLAGAPRRSESSLRPTNRTGDQDHRRTKPQWTK